MKLDGDITINGEFYPKGSEVSWRLIYPFFLGHMLAFGGSVFLMAYGKHSAPTSSLYLWGGFSALVYTLFYLRMFGLDEIKWMFINAALGILGICSQIDWILALFGKRLGDYPFRVHVVPFLYFVLYTFLLRHAVLDLTRSREDPVRRKRAETVYVVISAAVYVITFFFDKT